MNNFFLSIYDALSKRKWLAVAASIVCVALCIFAALNLHYSEDISDFLPQDPEGEKYTSVYNNLGGQDRIVVIFSKDDARGSADDYESITSAMNAFGEMWAEVDTASVASVQISVDEMQALEIMNFVQSNYPYFMSQEEYERADSLLSLHGYVSRQLEARKRALMLPTGSMVAQSMRYDPLELFPSVLRKMQSFNSLSDYYKLAGGYIFNKEGDKGLAFILSPYGISESMQNQRLAEMIEIAIAKTEQQVDGIEISAVGAPLIAVTNAQQIKRDSLITVTLAVVLIFIILILSFRRSGDLLWIGASILFGSLFALGVISIFKSVISIIVLGIGSVIIGIAVNYPLHFLDHLKHSSTKRVALREMVSPLLIGNITTVSAFLCLLFLKAEAMRDLGLFGALTLIGTILFVLVLLPPMVKSRRHSGDAGQWHLNMGRFVAVPEGRGNKFVIPIVVLLTCVLAYFGQQTSFDSNMQHINYMTPQQRDDLQMLYSSVNRNDGTATVYAVAESGEMQLALQNNEQLLATIGKDTAMHARVNGIGYFIPSKRLQEQSLQLWRQLWEKHGDVINEINVESKRLGFSQKAFAPFIESVEAAHELQEVEYFTPIIAQVGKNYIMKDDSLVRIVNHVSLPANRVDEFKEYMNANLSQSTGFVFDASDVGNRLVSLLSDEFDYVGFVCGFVVFFFLWVSFGRFELSLLSFLPLAVSWIWIMGIMGLFDIRFNIVNIILATFIFGQGDDYTIFITEGLMYEYAYGKKVLASYKNSVALSAVIMFIGMGMLIFAKHPAMKSLAEVAIIGMLTVVMMAYYLPPLVFRWLTMRNGVVRDVPITLKRWAYSVFSFSFFLLGMYVLLIPFTFFYFHIGKVSEKKRLWYHGLLQRISSFVVRHVPGVKFHCNNKYGETFDEPCVIISNHQSHLDLMCIMMLTPRLVILTNDWVWHNPFYGMVIRHAEFYPVSDGIDKNLARLQSLVTRGYSVVVFPEGTRSADCSILRFHRGAFYLAQQLGIGILPVYLHGVGHVLPKNDFMLREGCIYTEVGKRIPAAEVQSVSDRKLTAMCHKMYVEHYSEICNQCETVQYFVPYVRYKYMYKGHGIEMANHRALKSVRPADVACDLPMGSVVKIENCGQGEFAWVYALVNKGVEVYATDNDEELLAVAVNTSCQPRNLHFVVAAGDIPKYDKCIDVKKIM